jgi:site-specific recombinase XerD
MRLEIFLTLWFFPPIYIYKFFIGIVKEAIEFDNRLIMRNSPEAHEADLSQHIAQIFKRDEQASEQLTYEDVEKYIIDLKKQDVSNQTLINNIAGIESFLSFSIRT